ncbi:MAG: YqiA/YcfP family alpha/beta fold hydrolase [Desulfobacterales bacterium]
MLKDKFLSFEENRTAWLVKWSHGDTGRKTLLCLHGYLLGDPDQAECMFKIEKLYQMGLDMALCLSPFHWRRAPKSRRLKGIFLEPEDAPMTCECFGQTMHDLYQCISLLEQQGTREIGIVGASLGGYNAALIASLTDRILVVAARGDKLCPFENVLSLCEKWQWPRHLFMTGGHWLMFNARARGMILTAPPMALEP